MSTGILSEDLYSALYSWANGVLNTERPTLANTPIIKSEQNAPPPTTGPYIVIGHSPTVRISGRPYKATPDANGKQGLYQDDELVIELWEVNSDGDLLGLLANSLDRQDIIDTLAQAGFSFMSLNGDIQDLDTVEGGIWRHEHLVELNINTRRLTEFTPGLIEEVEGEGTMPHQGKSGNITPIIGG